MEEKKIDPKPGIVEAKSFLASEKSEVVAELQQEICEMADERLFEVTFRVLVLQIEKFQDERIFDGLLRRNGVAGFGFFRLLKHGSFVLGEGDALIELAANLTIELAN